MLVVVLAVGASDRKRGVLHSKEASAMKHEHRIRELSRLDRGDEIRVLAATGVIGAGFRSSH